VFRNIKSAKIYREGSLELDSGLMIRQFPVRSFICIATVIMGSGGELSGCGDSDNRSRGDLLLIAYSRNAAWFHVTICCQG
jgi:hypothetical protein